jgi:hypothetical protein
MKEKPQQTSNAHEMEREREKIKGEKKDAPQTVPAATLYGLARNTIKQLPRGTNI